MLATHFARCEGAHCRCEFRRYSWALLAAGLTFLVELTGSYLTNSVSLLADAVHLFTDCVDLVIGLGIARMVQQRRLDEQATRAKGGVVSACLLFTLVGLILWESIPRLFIPEGVSSLPMLAVATAGLIGNRIQQAIIESGEEEHRTQKSLSTHFGVDVFLSGAVISGGVVVYLSGWTIIDPVVSLGVAAYVVKKSRKLFWDSWAELFP